MEQKTPLYTAHTDAEGKMVAFCGWQLPIQYQGLMAEHKAVRSGCGLFDVSHMGEIFLSGGDALANLNYLLTNDFTDMAEGQARYTLMCYEDGGVVDDLIVYKSSDTAYLLVVNACNTDKDFDWISDHLFGACNAKNVSSDVAQLALQGPKAEEILRKVSSTIPEKNYTAIYLGSVGGIDCMVSRTGYTGEDGFELYCSPQHAQEMWKLLLEVGQEEGLVPCGLGARDTLRLEAGMPLYGHELSATINPFEAVLGFFVKMDKENFLGKAALEAARPISRRRVSLKITGRGIAREGCPVYDGDRQIGTVTSGTHCPWLGGAYAMALVDADYKEIGTTLTVDVRGKMVEAEIMKGPFYKRA